jgi:hypothetical protein
LKTSEAADSLGRNQGAETMKHRCGKVFSAMIPYLFFAWLGLDPAWALMLEMGTPELTHQAEAIVRGNVKDMKSEWDPQKRFIWTLVTVSVSKSIKGPGLENQDVIVKIPGGVVGDIGQKTEDAPIFTKGEEVLLFLTPEVYREIKVFRVTGHFQGKHTIKDNKFLEKKIPVETFIDEIEKAK